MSRKSIRENLLKAGDQLVWNTGYAGTGVRDIVEAAGARPGSFTNHFTSKEDFVIEVLDRYFAYVSGLVEEALGDRSVRPVDRLRRYIDLITGKLADADYSRGCMIGNLSLEASFDNERLRAHLSKLFAIWRGPFEACIAEGLEKGEIAPLGSAAELADFLLSAWQGAMLRMKVDRSPAPLATFRTIVFSTVFDGGKHA